MDEALARALGPSRARRLREVIRAALAALAFALSCAAQAADPVAFVADLRGNATIEGDGKLVFLAELAPGARLLLGTGATVAVIFANTGTEFTINGPGEFLVTQQELRAEKGASPTRRNVIAPTDPAVVSQVTRTATASFRMRGVAPNASARSALEFPVDTRVATLQPELRWRGSEQAATVTLSDANGTEVWKGAAGPTARAPMKLSPAMRYTWTVTSPKGVLGEAHFETLSAEAIGKVEKSRASSRTFSDRVMHAFLLRNLGANQEAREAWAALARERPDLPELAALAR